MKLLVSYPPFLDGTKFLFDHWQIKHDLWKIILHCRSVNGNTIASQEYYSGSISSAALLSLASLRRAFKQFLFCLAFLSTQIPHQQDFEGLLTDRAVDIELGHYCKPIRLQYQSFFCCLAFFSSLKGKVSRLLQL